MLSRAVGGALALGAAVTGYAALEARSYRLREVTAPVLAPGARPLRLLHLSDLHMTPGDSRLQAWVRSLDETDPHLVVDTGDNLAHAAAVPAVLAALAPLLARPGAFVLGSNDYHGPRAVNPARYLLGPSRADTRRSPRAGARRSRRADAQRGDLPWPDLVAALTAAGWADLTNARARLRVDGRDVELVGVDDPHLRRDRYHRLSRPRSPDADLSLGVTHAPYRRVLDAMAGDGLDLLLAGHTHGGQLRAPRAGALVTNCDLPRALARGLHPWRARGGVSALHVSAGLGTAPSVRLRFACPPEATLLTLVARP